MRERISEKKKTEGEIKRVRDRGGGREERIEWKEMKVKESKQKNTRKKKSNKKQKIKESFPQNYMSNLWQTHRRVWKSNGTQFYGITRN